MGWDGMGRGEGGGERGAWGVKVGVLSVDGQNEGREGDGGDGWRECLPLLMDDWLS